MGQAMSYARALLDDIKHAVEFGDKDREKELRTELDKHKDAAVAEAHAEISAGGSELTATTLSNGQVVPSTLHAELSKFLTDIGGDAPDALESKPTDPVQPVIVDPPLAANPANLTTKDGTDPVTTPPVVTQIQENGVATVVAPSAPETDMSPPAAPVFLDTSTVPSVGSDAPAEELTGAHAAPESPTK